MIFCLSRAGSVVTLVIGRDTPPLRRGEFRVELAVPLTRSHRKLMRAVISVANVAARSGKTTVAVNLAAEFSARGIRTLLIDADPQARATPFFIKPNQIVRTLSDVLLPATARKATRAAG